MGIIFVPFYIKYLGIEAYGLIGIFASMQVWFALLDMGMAPALGREMARFSVGARTIRSILDLFYSLETVYALAALFLAVGVFFFAPWLSTHWLKTVSLSDKTIAQALVLIGIVIALRWLGTLYRSALIGLQRQVWLSSFNAIFATLRGGGVTLVLVFGIPSIQSFFIYQAIVGAAESLVLARFVRRVLHGQAHSWRFSFAAIKEIGRFAAGMALITLLSILLTQIDKLILSKLLTLREFGYYSLATTAAGALYLLITPVANAAYPRLTGIAANGSKSELADGYHLFSQVLVFLLVPATVVLAMFPSHFLLLWTRDETATAAVAPLFSILLIGNMLNGLMHMPYNLQLAHGWTRFTVRVNTVSLLLLAPLVYFGVKHYGAIAAALVWAALNLGYILVAVPIMHKRLLPAEKWPWFKYDIALPLVAIVAITSVIRSIMPAANIANIGATIETVFIASMAAFATAMVTVPIAKLEIRRWLKRSA
jgi:O-antigen/teichoic acid export membrane protein